MPTTGSVVATSATEVITMARAILQRWVKTGTMKKTTNQTGLKTKQPHKTPATIGQPNAKFAHPQRSKVTVRGEFCPRFSEPGNPGKARKKKTHQGYQIRPS